ncbi:hypothetical protein V6N13_114087 [Hibiscus sabdariffa]|uniref:Uncharacterized protein n=1 Tax=Hibiscus sabdariffa TaxID=183260 RepID=A0ABR2U0S8_9ROSI
MDSCVSKQESFGGLTKEKRRRILYRRMIIKMGVSSQKLENGEFVAGSKDFSCASSTIQVLQAIDLILIFGLVASNKKCRFGMA